MSREVSKYIQYIPIDISISTYIGRGPVHVHKAPLACRVDTLGRIYSPVSR